MTEYKCRKYNETCTVNLRRRCVKDCLIKPWSHKEIEDFVSDMDCSYCPMAEPIIKR